MAVWQAACAIASGTPLFKGDWLTFEVLHVVDGSFGCRGDFSHGSDCVRRVFADSRFPRKSIRASVPSRIALAMSVTSARVGRGLTIIDSSIWVAVMTGLPTRFAHLIISFWMSGISGRGTSNPKSPLANHHNRPASVKMLSKLSNASRFSSLAMIGISELCS